MEKRVEPAGGVGCLVAVVGAGVGFGTWLRGSRPGLRGGFEGQRDWSLLYVELPLMLFGVPVVALTAWALTRAVLRRRVRRGVLTAASGRAAVITLAALAWMCHAWLDVRADDFLQGDA